MMTVNYSECGGFIANNDFPIGINFQSKGELETFTQSIFTEVQNPVYAFNSYKCFRINRNINLSVWEIKNLSEDKFPITIFFKDKVSIDRLACSYYREKFQAQPNVCDVPSSSIPENNDDEIDDEITTSTRINKQAIFFGLVIVFVITLYVISSTDWKYLRNKREARRVTNELAREAKSQSSYSNQMQSTYSYSDNSSSNVSEKKVIDVDVTGEWGSRLYGREKLKFLFNNGMCCCYFVDAYTNLTRGRVDGRYSVRGNEVVLYMDGGSIVTITIEQDNYESYFYWSDYKITKIRY
ncbi:MAG: hypothetical protein MJY61_00095 [Bacteroidales bacterium]|nr:hypothetical protein [Bacteroidales bacterium]